LNPNLRNRRKSRQPPIRDPYREGTQLLAETSAPPLNPLKQAPLRP
jgi:hypothetical protein